MIIKNISQAKAELSALIAAVQKGQVILIGKAGKPVAKIMRYDGIKEKRRPGALKGKISIKPDFDSPLPADLEEAFGIKK